MPEIVKRPTMVPRTETSPPRAESIRELLAFVLADEAYAFPLHRVREILKPPPITPVPRASRFVMGIISVRGVITTVVDLRRLVQVAEGRIDKSSRVLLVDVGGEILGALVDEVLQVYRLGEDELELASALGGDLSEHVIGIGRPRAKGRDEDPRMRGRDLIVLLDPEPLFARLARG